MKRISCRKTEWIDASRIVGVDIETTGLNRYVDEILSVSIVDGNGKMLFDQFFRPSVAKEWPEAQAVNGISPEDVKDCPEIFGYLEIITSILSSAEVIVTYNGINFDIPWLRAKGVNVPDVPICDVMLDFAPIYGEWSDYWDEYRWQTLETCAYHYKVDFRAHNSLEDIRATMACMHEIAQDQIMRLVA